MLAVPKLQVAAIVTVAGAAVTYSMIDRATVLAAFGIGLSIWLLLSTLTELAERIQLFQAPFAESWRRFLRQPRASWGMTLAHGGLAIAVAGMTASSAWTVESIQTMRPGETVSISGYKFTLRQVRQVQGPNYQARRATFDVTKGTNTSLTLEPEKRVFTVSQQQTTEAAIHSTFLGDLYAVVGDPDGKGGFITRLYFNPLVPWLWVGAFMMVLGAIISLSDRRHRVGAPSVRRSPDPDAVKTKA
jgi:cytochrome c-type biogenesis protein CcmF